MIPQSLGELFLHTAKRYPHKKAFLYKIQGQVASYTWNEFRQKVNTLASFFLSQNVTHGDRIAILSENRPEWALVDLAAQSIGAVTVPIYTSLSAVEIQYLLSDSGASAVAVSNREFLEKITLIQKSLPSLRFVLSFDPAACLSQNKLDIPLYSAKDAESVKPRVGEVEARLGAVRADDLASIIYTSGTTGPPKGAMLTHANFLHNARLVEEALKMGPADVHLSFLPLSHVFERLCGYYLMIYIGATITYAESMDTVPQNLLEAKPTFILGVPRFYEKIKDKVLASVNASSAVKKGIFYWAKAVAGQKKKSGLFFKLEHALADFLVYRKFRKGFGGRVRFCVSGSAALPKDVAGFFYDLGITILEGYGLTETSPVITANRESNFKFGTVGLPLSEVEVKITEDGEIATKSPCVMKGYYEKEAETSAVLRDGWFYTGDFGHIDKEGFLSITGRKKELIVTSGGKKISPQRVEPLIENDPYILRCVLYGEGRKFLTALIVPQQERLLEYARDEKIAYSGYPDLLRNQRIYSFLEERIEALSKDLARFEKIKYFALLEHDFSQSAGELTPTLKVKREVVLSRYKERLLPFYEKEGHS